MIIGGFVHNNSIKNSREVSGKIVDFIERKVRNSKGRTRTYKFPVYESYDNLEPKLYQSRERESTQGPIGSEETLYISADGFIIEKITCVKLLVMGLVFLAFGVFFIFNAVVQ